MKNFWLLLFLPLIVLLNSCTYDPTGEKMVKLDQNGVTPQIKVNLNLAQDTLYVPVNSKIEFAYELNSDKVNWAQFKVNGVVAGHYSTEIDIATLSRTFTEKPGTSFVLELQIFSKSQTGSIADNLGAEGFLSSQQWNIVMVESDQIPTRISAIGFEDGYLKISWQKYLGTNFKNYKIYKNMPYSPNGKVLLGTIHSRHQTSWVDSTYGGEESDYYILTNDTYQGPTGLSQGPIPVITSENTPTGDLLFKWSKPPYYKSLRGYRISYYDNTGAFQQSVEINDPSCESYTIANPLFGHSYQLYLTPLNKLDNRYSQTNLINLMSSRTTGFLGQRSPSYDVAVSGQGSTVYFLKAAQKVILFDPLAFQTIKELKYDGYPEDIAVSADNQYLITSEMSCRKIYMEYLAIPSKSKTIDITPINVSFRKISISNAGIGMLMSTSKGVLYDFINEKKLGEVSLTGTYTYSNKVSASGKYFYLDTYSNNAFYQYKDNQLILLEAGVNQGDQIILDCWFVPGTSEKMIRAYRNRIEILDCNSWTIDKSWLFSTPITHVYNFDIQSGKLLINENNKMETFDITTGTKKELAQVEAAMPFMQTLFYTDGYLFWGWDTALKIK